MIRFDGGNPYGCTSMLSQTTWIEWNNQLKYNQPAITIGSLSGRGLYDPWPNWMQTQSVLTQNLPTITCQGTTSTTTLQMTWLDWNQQRVAQYAYNMFPSGTTTPHMPLPDNPEQLAAKLEAARRREVERAAAKARAGRLLTSHLSEEQREELEEHGYFTVRPISGRTYRIRRGHSRNIDLVDINGARISTLCAHPNDMSLPDEDHMLAQALHLLHNEAAFLAIANRS
jgi:hypothetical protein